MNRDHQTIRAAITNEVIRAVAALRQQRTVAREQDGQTVFVPGTEAAREYLIETLDRAFGDSTSPATPVEPTCVACDKGGHRHCFGGVCACIHSRDWKRQDEEWSAGDDQPASHLPPAALPAVSGEGERQGNYYGHRLTAGVSDGRVVIAVGVETLAHAVAYADWSNPFDDAADEYIRTFAIADAPQFAKDMVSAMLAEREDGSTPLSEFLDRMARAAIEDGSLGLDDAEYRIKHGEHAPCETWARASTPTPGAEGR